MGFSRDKLRQTHWHTKNKGKLLVEGSFFSSDVSLLIEAAVSGMGIAMLPSLIIKPLLESGSLVRVLANILEGEAQVALVYPEREFVPPQVKAFIEAVLAWAPGAFEPKSKAKPKAAKSKG